MRVLCCQVINNNMKVLVTNLVFGYIICKYYESLRSLLVHAVDWRLILVLCEWIVMFLRVSS